MRCYWCGGMGHRESECMATPRHVNNGESQIRRAQPNFVFEIKNLGAVLMRDRRDTALAMDGFGVEVLGGAIRLVQTDNRVSFFGIPTSGCHFRLILPMVKDGINFHWDERRLSCEFSYAMTPKLFKAVVDGPIEPIHEPEFTLVCAGQFVRDFVIRFGIGEDAIEYLVIQNGRGHVCITPMTTYESVCAYRTALETHEDGSASETEEREETNPERDENGGDEVENVAEEK